MRLMLLAAAALLPASLTPCAAQEADWRFCVAADYNLHVAYLTAPFESEATGRELEANVGAWLAKQNLPYQNVQCRLPTDLPDLAAERDDAKTFVKALGFKLTKLR